MFSTFISAKNIGDRKPIYHKISREAASRNAHKVEHKSDFVCDVYIGVEVRPVLGAKISAAEPKCG